jgi:PelA/Pel-15E family pectate lyase
MRLKNPSPEVKSSVAAAVKWFDAYKIAGYRFDRNKNTSALVADNTSMTWARFYDLEKTLRFSAIATIRLKQN